MIDFGKYERDGKVLTSYSILKQDYRLESTSNARFPRLMGAPNFFGSNNLYSLGQPTVSGIESSLVAFGKSEFVWMNLREEPVIYLNGDPFVLRDVSRPFANISSFGGISSENIEEFEKRLKADVLEESTRNRGFVWVHEEMSHKRLVRSFVRVDTIMTTREVFFLMLSRGYDLVYFRVPLPSYGFVSETGYLNEILQVLEQNMHRNPVFLFNSSSGKNRSTFALVFTSIFLRRMDVKFSGHGNVRDVSVLDPDENGRGGDESSYLEEIAREVSNTRELARKWRGSEEELALILRLCMEGRYRVLNNVLGVVDKRSKRYVDCLIDKFGDLVNLRKSILYECVDTLLNNTQGNGPTLALERYATLILFAEYSFRSNDTNGIDFISWLSSSALFSNFFSYLKNKKHDSSMFFPINIIAEGPGSEKRIGDTVAGRYTVLIKFDGRGSPRAGHRITMTQAPMPKGGSKRIWINLKAEPCLFVDGEMFVLKELLNVSGNVKHLRGIKPGELENLETRLKQSVVSEMEETGRILTYRYTDEDIERLEICGGHVKSSGILTSREYFEKIGYPDGEYFRIPTTDGTPFGLDTFDQLMDVCSRVWDEDIVVQSDGYPQRSSYAAMAVDLILNISDGVRVEPIKFRPIHSVVRVLKHGRDSFHKVNFLYDKYTGNSINILNLESFRTKDVVVCVKMFYLLICFASYLKGDRRRRFSEVMEGRAEIMRIYEGISSRTKDEMMLDSIVGIVENYECIKDRSGKVLGSMTILKNDYFIGSSLFSIDNPVESTKNLRLVFDGGILFVGLGMPTREGICNVLKRIVDMGCVEQVNAAWFCLREEPVVYINENPYVLRYVTKLTENIETRGISYDVVETVEDELVQDVLAEGTGRRILLHDDVVFKDQIHTVGKFHDVEKVESVRSFFESFHFRYFRIAITDEQAPLPDVFDVFHSIVGSDRGYNVLFFNCQVGRGRTTTAMVISYLVRNASTFDFTGREPAGPRYKMISKLVQILPNSERSKALTDFAVDKFSHLENLRLSIDRYSVGSHRILRRGKDFLLRYFYMIVFCEFLIQGREETFSGFLRRCPEITSLASEIDVIELETVF